MKHRSIRSIYMLLGGCVSAKFTKTGVYSLEKRPPDCDISVFTTAPTFDYKEIGFVDFKGGEVSIKTALNVASEYVCESGGNAILLSGPTTNGAFSAATVLLVELEQNRK